MPLDPQMQVELEKLYAAGLFPIPLHSAEAARRAVAAAQRPAGIPEAVGAVEDRTLPGPGGGIPVRIYSPLGAGPFPLLVYFHGGGWVLGELDGYDAWCRRLTNRAL